MGVFAVLLFVFETRFACTEDLIRRNFGFMFTYMVRESAGANGAGSGSAPSLRHHIAASLILLLLLLLLSQGRTIFLIFLSAVCFGMLDPNQTSTPQ